VDESGKALLCDFGLCRIRYEISRTHTQVLQGGRVRFVAPELWSDQDPRRTTEASDTYSLAMTIYALGTQQSPFSQYHNDFAVVNAALSGTRPEQPDSLGGLSPRETAGLWKIMSEMWKQDPLRRPSMHLVKARFNMLFDTSNTT
jgi:serine/threonine protein kinase